MNLFKQSLPYLPPIVVLLATRVMGFEGVYGQDAYEYARYTEALSDYFLGGAHPGEYFWPVLYPVLGAVLNLILPVDWSLQIISLAAVFGIIFLLKKMLARDFPEVSPLKLSLFLTIAISLSPYFLRTSVLCMTDMAAAFFVTSSFYGLWLTYRQKSQWGITLFMIAGMAAVMTRYATVIIVLSLGMALVVYLYRTRNFHFRQILIGSAVALIIALPHIWLHGQDLEFAGHSYLENWSLVNFFKRSFITIDGENHYLVPNILHVLSPLGHAGYFLLGIPLLAYGLYKNGIKSNLTWRWLLVVPYLFFLAGIPFQNQRFFVVIFPLVVLAAFPFFNRLDLRNIVSRVAILGAISLQVTLFVYSFSKFYKMVATEQEVTSFLKETKEVKKIYTMGMDVCFGYYEVPHQVENIYFNEYNDFEKGALFLANPEFFEGQWKDKKPGRNWQLAKSKELELMSEFDLGWKLYVIK